VYEAEGINPLDTDFIFAADTGLTRSYTKSVSITPGATYNFKVRAKNFDFGPLSDPVDRIAATVPGTPINLELVSQSTVLISFSWD